jgi:hypothetical protein
VKYPLNPSFPEGPAASISLHKKGFSGALFNALVNTLAHLLPGLLRMRDCSRQADSGRLELFAGLGKNGFVYFH